MKISLITVCFNSEPYILDTLRSVDSQSWADLEHIIVDGASQDGTLKILDSNKKPWRTVYSEPDNGIYDAMNKGIKYSNGDVIAFINSDDLYASEFIIERVAKVFEDPMVDGCYGDLCYVKQDDVDSIVRYWQSSDYKPSQFIKGWVPPHPTLFLRREMFERFGMFDLQFPIAADFELMLRMLEVKRIKIIYLPEVLVKMRLGGTTNRSLANIIKQNKEIIHALNKHGVKVSLFKFLVEKFSRRILQFFERPI